ncbi:MAG: spirocyclase AveC family protein, partial [Pseudomonadota bacterium]|nr:spirocyclase AveC family protein [Pseudomonadota bacterium]
MSDRIGSAGAAPRSALAGWLWWLFALGILGVIAWFARTGAVSPRIANPEVTGVPRPVEVLFGFPYWLELQQFFCVVAMVVLIVVCIAAWRRQPGHPYVLMAIASTAIVWQDPIMN